MAKKRDAFASCCGTMAKQAGRLRKLLRMVLRQLSKAFEPQNPPQQLAKVSRLLCHGTSRGAT